MATSAKDIKAGRAFVELGVNDKLTKAIDAAQAKLKSFASATFAAGLRLGAMGLALLSPLGLAAGRFASMGDELNKASQRTGVAVEALSQLKYAAEQSDASLEDLEKSIRSLGKTIQEAGTKEGKSARESLEALGLTLAEIQGLPPDVAFQRVAGQLAKIPDPAERAALAMEVFGKSGYRLLPLIAEGAEGIDALRRRAEELGLVMSKDDAEAATTFGDIVGDLQLQVKAATAAVGAHIAKALLPYAERATEGARKAIEWARANGQLVVSIGLAGVALVGLGGALIAASGAATTLDFSLNGVKAVLAIVSGAVSLLVSPLGVLTVALGLTAAAFIGFGKTWEAVSAYLRGAFENVRADAVQAFAGIKDAILAGDWQLAARIMWATLKVEWQRGADALQRVWVNFKSKFLQVASATFRGAQAFWEELQTGIASQIVTIQGWLRKLADDFNHDGLDRGAAIDQETRRMIAGLEADKNARLQAIGEGHASDLAEIDRQANEDLQKNTGELEALREELRRLREKAAAERAAAPAFGAAPDGPSRFAFDPDDISARLKKSADEITSRGTFNGAAVQSLEGTPTLDQIAQNTRETAKNTRNLRAGVGGRFT